MKAQGSRNPGIQPQIAESNLERTCAERTYLSKVKEPGNNIEQLYIILLLCNTG